MKPVKYVQKDPETQASQEVYGVPILNFDSVLAKMEFYGVDLQKFVEDEEKKKIPVLYDYYSEVVNQYIDYTITAEVVHFKEEDVMTRAVKKDQMFKEDFRNLVAHVYSIKELDKELLMGYANWRLVMSRQDEKGKMLFYPKPGYIRMDHTRKFLRMLGMQMQNQERPHFLWGLKPSKPEIKEMVEEEVPYLIEDGDASVIGDTEEEPAPKRRNKRLVMD